MSHLRSRASLVLVLSLGYEDGSRGWGQWDQAGARNGQRFPLLMCLHPSGSAAPRQMPVRQPRCFLLAPSVAEPSAVIDLIASLMQGVVQALGWAGGVISSAGCCC